MLNFYSHSLPILTLFLYCHALKYVWVPPYYSNISLIPDHKYHSFIQSIIQAESIIKNITPAHPVLRGCTVNRVYEAYFRNGQPRTEILTIFQEKRGEFLVNVTLNGRDVYVNGKFYVKVRWTQMNNVAEVDLDKHPNRTRVWVVMELAGDVKFMPPEYEWVYINVEDEPCSEVKIKVVEGYAELLFKRTHTAFPAESYEDILFSSSTTSDTASTASITLQSEIDKDSNKKEVQNESIITGLVCAAISILVLIFTALLSFVGCRLGRWHARKEALKKGLIKVEETVASTTPDNVENKTTEPAVTSVSTNVRRAIPSPNMASENASMPKVKDPKTPTTEKDSSALSKKSDNFA